MGSRRLTDGRAPKKQCTMDRFLTRPHRHTAQPLPRMISVDMDGTVADITKRLDYATRRAGTDKGPKFYNILLNGSLYKMDEPIAMARDFLEKYAASRGDIVYLSGRRAGTEGQSDTWLRQHGFPSGRIIHRRSGQNSHYFKQNTLLSLKRSHEVEAHFGDRPSDDGGAAEGADVRFILVSSSQWPTFEEVFGERVETVVTSPLKVEAANSNEEGEPVVERVEA